MQKGRRCMKLVLKDSFVRWPPQNVVSKCALANKNRMTIKIILFFLFSWFLYGMMFVLRTNDVGYRHNDALRFHRKMMWYVPPMRRRGAHHLAKPNITCEAHITFRAAEHIVFSAYRKYFKILPYPYAPKKNGSFLYIFILHHRNHPTIQDALFLTIRFRSGEFRYTILS